MIPCYLRGVRAFREKQEQAGKIGKLWLTDHADRTEETQKIPRYLRGVRVFREKQDQAGKIGKGPRNVIS